MVRVTEIHLDIGRQCKSLMVDHFLATIPCQGLVKVLRQLMRMLNEAVDDGLGILARHLHQHDVARLPLDQRSPSGYSCFQIAGRLSSVPEPPGLLPSLDVPLPQRVQVDQSVRPRLTMTHSSPSTVRTAFCSFAAPEPQSQPSRSLGLALCSMS